MTRGGIYGEMHPEPEGNPEGRAQRVSQGLRLYFTVDKAIWIRMDPLDNSAVAALENTHGQESNTKRGKFQHYTFK